MGTISQKLNYTLKAIDDIQKALEEKGFDMNSVELSKYGSLIRLIVGSSTGGDTPPDKDKGQILNGLKLDNTYFISKDIQHITQKDIEYNTYFISKALMIIDINNIKIKQEE